MSQHKVNNIPEEEIQRIRLSYLIYNVPEEFQEIIEDAIKALNNGEFLFDGSTGDLELWTTLYEPSALVHDYLWMTGQGGSKSDKIFYRLMTIYKVPIVYAQIRWFFVRIGWVLIYKRIHRKKNNLKGLKPKYLKLLR